MFLYRTFIGLDVHARTTIAHAIVVDANPVRKKFGHDPDAVIAWVQSLPEPVTVTYEAGPTGYDLARRFADAGIECVVAAPSKLQRPAGDRVKTDARDAEHLAKLLQLGQVVPVTVPTVTAETARDLVRAREDVRGSLMTARHRLAKLLMRHGHVYEDGVAWTTKHDRWVREHRAGTPAFLHAFDAAYETVEQAVQRRDRLDLAITELATDSEFTPMVHRLGCLRGVSTLTGFALAVEITNWDRFTGKTIGSYLGLTPSEHSSGGSRRLGGITKTGNTHARRLLVEAAWHHRRDYRPGASPILRARQELAPVSARLRGQAGNERLHRQWTRFLGRQKKPTIANVAIARELAGWCWSLAVMRE